MQGRVRVSDAAVFPLQVCPRSHKKHVLLLLSADSCAILVSIQMEIKLVSITALGASCEVALGLRLDTVSGVERLSVTFG